MSCKPFCLELHDRLFLRDKVWYWLANLLVWSCMINFFQIIIYFTDSKDSGTKLTSLSKKKILFFSGSFYLVKRNKYRCLIYHYKITVKWSIFFCWKCLLWWKFSNNQNSTTEGRRIPNFLSNVGRLFLFWS